MEKVNNYTLGIDMGTNSIGWSVIEHDDNFQPTGLIVCGTRIFQEAVDAKLRIPKNHARRAARSARRLVARRKMRRITLLQELIKQKMLPENEVERLTLISDDKKYNPYFLRKHGLDQKLDLYELGRVLFHLNQRRGFKSNLKAQLGEIFKQYPDILELVKRDEDAKIAVAQERILKRKEKIEADGKTFDAKTDNSDNDEGIIQVAISQLQKNIRDEGCRTLGEYLWKQPKKRKTITDRKMYEDEFEALWKVQRQYYPAILTDDLRALLFSIIFHQRPLKTQKFLVGRCQFEPSRKRAAKALLEVQHFRILQDINNLKVKNPKTRIERPLSPEERKILFDAFNANTTPQYNDTLNKQSLNMLNKSGKMTWGKIRKLLGGLHKGEKFNLEEGGKELIGNRTALTMRVVLGEEWDKMPEERQKALLTDILTINRKDSLIKRLRGSVWNFPVEQAYRLAITEFEPGYSNLSLKAIRKILPHLEDGLNYFLASFVAYDPCPHDKKASIIRSVTEGVAFDKACNIIGYDKPANQKATNKLGEPPYLRNPVVQKALYETRKVVNAIIHEYGKPATIRIEMARDMKLTKSQKEAVDEQNKINRKANKNAAQILFEIGKISSPDPKFAKPDDLLRYRLWEECRGICPYTGKQIGMTMLFSNEINIEHIIPYSRLQVDGYRNKTLCVATFNQLSKQNKTPYEYFAGNNEEYQNVLNRVGRFQKIKRCRIDKKTQKISWHEIPNPKIYLFEQKEVDTDKFVERQLNDTRYICVEVKKYLQQIGVSVEISKGEATAALRHRWNLNRILAEDCSLEKNRADHRHHAIDAIVIALTSRSLFQKLSRLSAQSGVALSERGFHLDKPWPSFYEDVNEKVKNIIVSHAPSHKINGALHEDTAYGFSEHEKCFVYRKPLDVNITLAQILNIRDKYVKELVIARLEKFEPEIRKAIDETTPKKLRYKITDKQAKDLMKKAFANAKDPLLHKDGKTLIKSVRIMDNTLKSNMLAVKNKSGQEYKYYPFGNNHHIEIIENTKTGKREGIVVTTAEAARRARNSKIPIVQKLSPWKKEGLIFSEDWKFVMSLAINDMLMLAKDNIKQYFRVQKISSNTQIFYLSHAAATLDESTSKVPNAFECRKVLIDVLGNIIACKND